MLLEILTQHRAISTSLVFETVNISFRDLVYQGRHRPLSRIYGVLTSVAFIINFKFDVIVPSWWRIGVLVSVYNLYYTKKDRMRKVAFKSVNRIYEERAIIDENIIGVYCKYSTMQENTTNPMIMMSDCIYERVSCKLLLLPYIHQAQVSYLPWQLSI